MLGATAWNRPAGVVVRYAGCLHDSGVRGWQRLRFRPIQVGAPFSVLKAALLGVVKKVTPSGPTSPRGARPVVLRDNSWSAAKT